MARYAIISGGVVTNVIEADEAFAAQVGGVASATAGVGDLWDGSVFSRPAPAPVVPSFVTMRQARLALLGAGKLAAVDTAIASLSSPAKEAAQIEWEYSNEVQRHNGFVAQLGPALGLDSAALDGLFIAAGGL